MAGDTGDLERRAWRSVFHDGLWDIALGTTFLGMGLVATFHLPRAWGYLLCAAAVTLGILVVYVGKRRITAPRLGWVRFGPRGERRRRNVAIVLAVGVLAMLALIPTAAFLRWRLPAFSPVSRLMAPAVAALVWTALSLIAAFWEFPRLYLHAVIIGASVFMVELWGLGWPLLVGSAIVVALGIVCLSRFLKHYPQSSPEVLNVNN